MAKHHRRRNQGEKVLIGIFVALLAALIIAIIVAIAAPAPAGPYAITADGHVHDASGNHIGDVYDMLESGELTLSADGHIHDQDGNHVGDLSQLTDVPAE